MDERLSKALQFSNYMVTLNNQKRIIKEKFFDDLLYFENGCQFTVTKELITFVSMLVDSNNDSDIVLTDDNDIPSKITDLSLFLENILDVYFSAANNYHTDYELLKSKRKMETLVDYDE